jgi:hypothetical protein
MGRRITSAVVLGALLSLGAVGTATPPSADASAVVARPAPDPEAGPCAGRDAWHPIRRYHATGLGRIRLRCGRYDGRGRWGYHKLVAKNRWNPWYQGMIGAVLESGEFEHQGSSVLYRSEWFIYCKRPYRFIVLVDTRTFGRKHSRGVVNAYEKFRKP